MYLKKDERGSRSNIRIALERVGKTRSRLAICPFRVKFDTSGGKAIRPASYPSP